MKTSNIFVGRTEEEVVIKLNEYLRMASKFTARNKKYQPLWKIYCIDGEFSLVFKLVPKDHNAIKEREAFLKESYTKYWNDEINSLVAP